MSSVTVLLFSGLVLQSLIILFKHDQVPTDV